MDEIKYRKTSLNLGCKMRKACIVSLKFSMALLQKAGNCRLVNRRAGGERRYQTVVTLIYPTQANPVAGLREEIPGE